MRATPGSSTPLTPRIASPDQDATAATRSISVAELERFAYCPLNWRLGLAEEAQGPGALAGQGAHRDLGEGVKAVRQGERVAFTAERIVLYLAVLASVAAVIGISFLPITILQGRETTYVLVILSLIWLLVATTFLFRSPTHTQQQVAFERIILLFSFVAVLLASLALTWFITDPQLALVSQILALVWLILASAFLYRNLHHERLAAEARTAHRIKERVHPELGREGQALISSRLGLSGRPDYIIEDMGQAVPVVSKMGRIPRGPLFSHLMQIAAHSALIEDITGDTVDYGIIRYRTKKYHVDFNPDLRRTLDEQLTKLRAAIGGAEVHRNHNRPGKCRGCSRRHACPESLDLDPGQEGVTWADLA